MTTQLPIVTCLLSITSTQLLDMKYQGLQQHLTNQALRNWIRMKIHASVKPSETTIGSNCPIIITQV